MKIVKLADRLQLRSHSRTLVVTKNKLKDSVHPNGMWSRQKAFLKTFFVVLAVHEQCRNKLVLTDRFEWLAVEDFLTVSFPFQ